MSGPAAALGASLVVLVAANLLNNRLAPRWYLVTSPVAAALLLAGYGLSGAPWAAAGLGVGALRRGAVPALVLVGLVGLAYAAGALLPATRPVFADRRGGTGPAGLAFQVLLRIPFGTVLLEEVAFRAVLYGLLRSLAGTVPATVGSAVLFGLWHVLPAGELPRFNPAAGRAFGGRRAPFVAATVLAMGLAGVVLCAAQRRTGSLVPPAALHWAVNGLGLATAYLVRRRSR